MVGGEALQEWTQGSVGELGIDDGDIGCPDLVSTYCILMYKPECHIVSQKHEPLLDESGVP